MLTFTINKYEASRPKDQKRIHYDYDAMASNHGRATMETIFDNLTTPPCDVQVDDHADAVLDELHAQLASHFPSPRKQRTGLLSRNIRTFQNRSTRQGQPCKVELTRACLRIALYAWQSDAGWRLPAQGYIFRLQKRIAKAPIWIKPVPVRKQGTQMPTCWAHFQVAGTHAFVAIHRQGGTTSSIHR